MVKESFDIIAKLKNCLRTTYHLEECLVDGILQKLWPFIERHNDHAFLEKFMELSATNVPAHSSAHFVVPADDPVVAAPNYHEVLAENERVRILWGTSAAGQQEPLHRHYWKAILIMLDDAIFEIKYADGSSEISHDKRGVCVVPADTQAAAYKNIGGKCRFVRFEIK